MSRIRQFQKYLKSKKMAYYRFVDDILILCNKQDVEKLDNGNLTFFDNGMV